MRRADSAFAIVEFFASESEVGRSGLSAREYAREEVLAGLRQIDP
jgi:hypothetical protein